MHTAFVLEPPHFPFSKFPGQRLRAVMLPYLYESVGFLRSHQYSLTPTLRHLVMLLD